MALTDLNRFFVKQKPKIIELTNEFQILDESGAEVGAIRQEGQSKLKKAARFVSSLDQFMSHTLAVYDASGAKVVELVRPRKIFKSRLEVTDGSGSPVGRIVQQNMVGKIRFGIEDPSGQALGSINAENWRAWDFSLQDASGREVGRITKKWGGVAKEMFTTADTYAVEISSEATGPLRLLLLASAAGVDTALKQDARGLG